MSETQKQKPCFIGVDGIVKQVELLCKKHPEGKDVGNTNCDCQDGSNMYVDSTLQLLETTSNATSCTNHEEIDFQLKIEHMIKLLSVERHKNSCSCDDVECQYYDIPYDCHSVSSLLGKIVLTLETSDKLESLTEYIVSILFGLRDLSISNGSDYGLVNNFYLYIIMCVFAYTHMNRLSSLQCKFPTQTGLLKYMKDSSTFKNDFHIFQKNVLGKINSFKKEQELNELVEKNKHLEAECIERKNSETAKEMLNFLQQLI